MESKAVHSTTLPLEDEAMIVAFRRHTLLPLDDCLYGLQPTIPHLTRSALHRCLQRHGISRLPEIESDKPAKRKLERAALNLTQGARSSFLLSHRFLRKTGSHFCARCSKAYPIGYFHIDIAEVRTEEGKLYLFVAIDRTSKLAFVRLVDKANTVTATAFLDELVAAVPYDIHTVLIDNGIQFADLPKNRNGPTARWRDHPFDRACWRYDIEHRLTKPNHP